MTPLQISEVGMIPEDWSVAQVREIGKIKNGINKPKEAFGRGTPFVNLMDVFGKSSISTTTSLELLETTKSERNTYDIKAGDVLFIRSSVKPSGVGLTTLVKQDLPDTVFSGFLLRFRDFGNLDVAFKEHCFHAGYFRTSLINNSTVSANTNINQSALGRLWLIVPPKPEQQAIAAALSDADGVVAGLERLIAKKRMIKQGAMQDLLTARRRLPGFSGEWLPRTLSSVSSFITKGATPTTYGFGWEAHGILFLRSECVSSRGLDLSQSMFISEEAHRATKRSEVTGGDILITITGNVGRVIRLPIDFGQANINQHIARIRINSGAANPDFVLHQLSRPEYLKHFNSIVTGQAYPQISLQQVREAEVYFPEVQEQLAIAQFLNDMDAEIQTLESRLAKARAVKEGMMQNLLTGRVRLV